MISIRHEGRGPYVSRTVIEWNGDISQGEADTVGEHLDRLLERGPGGLDEVLTAEQVSERDDDLAEELRSDLAEAEKRADEEEDRADAAEAELARVKGDVCGMCSRGHANDLGICARHGKPVRGFDLAVEFRALSKRYEDMRRKHEELSGEIVQLRAAASTFAESAKRHGKTAA
jgi:tetrahydromethanopterin S-methyltransferase subunit G